MNIIKNGTIITPQGAIKADLAFQGDKIVEIGDIDAKAEDKVYDAGGCFVFPGFIDQHTHLQANTGISWTADDFASGTTAAVCSGTTTLVDFATQDKGLTLQEAFDIWMDRAKDTSRCNFAFHMAICDWNEKAKAEIPEMKEQGICSFKVYMAYDHLKVNDTELLEIMESLKANNSILGCHCEIGDMVKELQAKEAEKGHLDPSAHPLSRPPIVEAEAIKRFLQLAKEKDYTVYVVHLSTKLGLEEIRRARQNGQTVYIESCPQYMLMDDSVYSQNGFEAAKYVCSPPLRKAEDVKALREAMVNGEIEAIATDHCSFNFETQKIVGKDDFRMIPNGMPGIEHRPSLISTILSEENAFSPELMNRLLSEGPAKMMGMYPRKGALAVGSDADITVWDPREKWTISVENQHQTVDYTPFENMEVIGKAKLVFVNGILASENGEPKDVLAGRYVKR